MLNCIVVIFGIEQFHLFISVLFATRQDGTVYCLECSWDMCHCRLTLHIQVTTSRCLTARRESTVC